MTLKELQTLLDSGKFHHATYRYELARGLHIYATPEPGEKSFMGFTYVGYFSDYDKATCDAAYDMVRKTGVSTGAYGRG